MMKETLEKRGYCFVHYAQTILKTIDFQNNFRSVDYINRYAITRGGKTCKYLFVYRLNFI